MDNKISLFCELLCECEDVNCKLSIKISFEEALKVKENDNNIIIIDGCQKGPNSTDALISKEKGYTIYKAIRFIRIKNEILESPKQEYY